LPAVQHPRISTRIEEHAAVLGLSSSNVMTIAGLLKKKKMPRSLSMISR
jgi:hypothetical protein